MRANRKGATSAHQHRVAVGCGLRDDVGADIAAGARPVVDDDLLSGRLGEMLARDTRHDVEDAGARRKRHDKADRARGIGLSGGAT